jgi:quinol monooxygenase YgiN
MAVIALLDLHLRADAVDTGLRVLSETLAATRAFPGCQGVSVLVDNADPTHVIAYETWESMERDGEYRKWRTTPDGASSLGTVLAGPPTLAHFTVAEGV